MNAIIPSGISGVVVVEYAAHADHRGAFARFFCRESLEGVLDSRQIVQINHSRTQAAGSVRGMHYQRRPHAEMKFVRCLKGKVWDVVVDLRADSPTLFQWHAEELTPQNGRMLVVPEGCAHGFQTLEDDSELLYLHTAPYVPGAEGGVHAADPMLSIAWPLPIANLSVRDGRHPRLSATFEGLDT